MPDSFDGFWPEADLGDRNRMRGILFSPAIFNHVFDVYNFSIISSLVDSDKPYAIT